MDSPVISNDTCLANNESSNKGNSQTTLENSTIHKPNSVEAEDGTLSDSLGSKPDVTTVHLSAADSCLCPASLQVHETPIRDICPKTLVIDTVLLNEKLEEVLKAVEKLQEQFLQHCQLSNKQSTDSALVDAVEGHGFGEGNAAPSQKVMELRDQATPSSISSVQTPHSRHLEVTPANVSFLDRETILTRVDGLSNQVTSLSGKVHVLRKKSKDKAGHLQMQKKCCPQT